MPRPKPLKKTKPLKKIIEKEIKERRANGNPNPQVLFRVPKSEIDATFFKKEPKHKYWDVSKDVNRYKSKTDFERIEIVKTKIFETIRNKFGNSTLIQIKDNIRDPRAKDIPNSLPRRSSVLGIINAVKKQGINQFAIAVTDVKTGKVMGYTVIGVSKKAIENHKRNYSYESEARFNSFIDNFIGKSEHPEQYYEQVLKEIFGFNIKHLTMPGYTIDPVTRDFRPKTIKERLKIKK
jgi:hypothetical protein